MNRMTDWITVKIGGTLQSLAFYILRDDGLEMI